MLLDAGADVDALDADVGPLYTMRVEALTKIVSSCC